MESRTGHLQLACISLSIVMPALVAGIHALIFFQVKGVDGRDKPTAVRQENCMRAFFALSWLARKLDQPISCF